MSNRVVAWTGFALGLLVLVFFGFITLFFAGSAASGCDQSFGPQMTHPAFCESDVARRVVALLPVIVVAVYLVGGIVGIVLLRRSRRVALVPAVLVVLGMAALAVDLVIVNS